MCIVHSNHYNVIVNVFCTSNCPQFLLFYLLVMLSLTKPWTIHRGQQQLGRQQCTAEHKGSEEHRLGNSAPPQGTKMSI